MTEVPEQAVVSTNITLGEVCLPVIDLTQELPFFLSTLGFQLEEIFPADDPAVAVISGYGLRIRLDRNYSMFKGSIRLRQIAEDTGTKRLEPLTSPSGHAIEFVEAKPPLVIPEVRHSFMVRRLLDNDPWVIGRAGMHYRDLIPDRLGGSVIASHIRIPDGGPVPDMVHYHKVGFQLIFCYRGWVRLVYEDQGEPFILHADNCVIQPPEIRHRVLEASDNLEVLEIGVPAEHITAIDHSMDLPNHRINRERRWNGTRFLHYKAEDTPWTQWRFPAWESRDTGIGEATQGIAGVHVGRPIANSSRSPDLNWFSHNADILFTFVKQGNLTLEVAAQKSSKLVAADAFVIPPYVKTRYTQVSADCELVEVALSAKFATVNHAPA